MIDSSHGWSGASSVSSVTAAFRVEGDRRGQPLSGVLGRAHEIGMLDLVRQIDLEPVGRIELGDIVFEALGRPVLHCLAELVLRDGHALRAVDLGESAGEHRLGLIVKSADELRLPAVPHAGADGADIGGGQDREQLQPLGRLHRRGEILDGLAVRQVARLRHARHHQMLFDQPGDGLGIGGREAKPWAEAPRHARTGDGMIFRAALGDVVQEQRDVEHAAVAGQDLVDQFVGERRFVVARRARSRQGRRCSGADAHPLCSGDTY